MQYKVTSIVFFRCYAYVEAYMQFLPNTNILYILVQTGFLLTEKILEMVQSLKFEACDTSLAVYEVLFLCHQVSEP